MPKGRSLDFLRRFVRNAIRDPEGTPDRVAIVSLSEEQERRVLTPRRLEILSLLGSREISSVSELARISCRSVEAVSRDLRVLANYALVDLEREGRVRRPTLVKDAILLTL